MTATWFMDTVRKVQRLGITYQVPQLVADLGHDHLEIARRQFAQEIVEAARTFAVEVHPDDVAATLKDSPADREERKRTRILTFDGRWWPGWRTPTRRLDVELRGGYYDGKVIPLFPTELDRVSLDVPHSPAYVASEIEVTGTMPRPDRENYELAGWNETDRRWVLAWT